jgi:hypothetical protein
VIFTPQLSKLTGIGLLALFSLVCAIGLTVSAQSGRRLPNSKPTASPPATPEQTATAEPTQKPKAAISIVVGIDSDAFSGVPIEYFRIALDNCADRIEQSPSVEVAGRRTHMSRGEAIRAAKGEKTAYLAWLQVRGDSVGADRSVHDITEVFIEYSLFAPATAKLVTSGRTYQRALRKGGVVVGPPTGSRRNGVYGQYLIREAARDAGERILSALEIPTGRPVPP